MRKSRRARRRLLGKPRLPFVQIDVNTIFFCGPHKCLIWPNFFYFGPFFREISRLNLDDLI